MKQDFADSLYWIALAHQRDQWHVAALRASRMLGNAQIMTTQEMLSEFLTAFRHLPHLRNIAVRRVQQITAAWNIIVLPQSDQSFQAALALYAARPGKEYSFADCSSMQVMRRHGIAEILTHDDHFMQEGFTKLL